MAEGIETIPQDLFDFPLMKALFGRRSRRFGTGMAIPDGPLKFSSSLPATPLSELEKTLLTLVGAGITGWSTGIEYTAASPGAGCNYPVRLSGRTFASAAGVHSSELIINDDSGTYLTQFRNLSPDHWNELSDSHHLPGLLSKVKRHCIPLSPERTIVPRETPHTLAHNFWNANQPGTTLFAPVIDITVMLFDLLAMNLGMGLIPFDGQNKRPCGDLTRFIESGLLKEGQRFFWHELEMQVLTAAAMEIAQIGQNQMLLLQAMGLGGWMFGGIRALTYMGAEPDVAGLGFRFQRNSEWSSPNPVGLDGHFESLCPPYQTDMRQAAAAFSEMKFGPGGTFDPDTRGPYLNNREVKSQVQRYSPEFVDLMGEVTQYIFDTSGRFPATIPSVYMRAYLQAQHIDCGFYDRYYGGDSYLDTHAEHAKRWHGEADQESKLVGLNQSIDESYANQSELYEAFATTTSLDDITHFLRWDAEQPPFYKYLRGWVAKASGAVLSELLRHIDIEEREEHSRLFREMMARLDRRVLAATTLDFEILDELNYTFSSQCAAREDIGFFLGGFLATEIMSAKRSEQLYRGLRRHDFSDAELNYLLIHFQADTLHGAEVMDQMIRPLLKEKTQLLPSIERGVYDRLSRSEKYLRWYETNQIEIKKKRRAV